MNALKSDYQLARRAVQLYPQTSYSDPQAVRHARRKWIASIKYLRGRGPGWVLDTVVGRIEPRAPAKPRSFSAYRLLERTVSRGVA